MSKKDATTVSLDDNDIDYIARVVQTEVPPVWRDEVLKIGVAAIVDTILNRVAYADFPDTVAEVVNQRHAFSKINGPSSYYNSQKRKRVPLNPYGSVQKAPKASSRIDRLVRQAIAERAAGGESIVGPSLHYANPNPAFSGVNARAPDGYVWLISQDPYLVTGFGKNYTHVHGTDPSMRPLGKAPEIQFVLSQDVDKRSIDDIDQVYSAPDGLDMVAPPIPAPKGAAAPVNPLRAELLDRVARKPLSFREFFDSTEAKLEFQKELAAGRENHVGPRLRSAEDYAALELELNPLEENADMGGSRVPSPKRKPSHSTISETFEAQQNEGAEMRRAPVPAAKPDRRASIAPKVPATANPFDLANQKLDQQVDMLKRNPDLARHLILAAGRDPEGFGFSRVA